MGPGASGLGSGLGLRLQGLDFYGPLKGLYRGPGSREIVEGLCLKDQETLKARDPLPLYYESLLWGMNLKAFLGFISSLRYKSCRGLYTKAPEGSSFK